ncbi:hypothetical protein DPEC_G00321480 [Dallia pectoralis]|uniref:Uncharacterized protein n=1 Tax=Dallia pectoralis TaxID=75939 RepID=A0ACC2FA82_DALPE|nr:hypothetical protein DPEC_G00321480 [Dallia pectoralis]
MEKQLLALGLSGTVTPVFSHDLQGAAGEKQDPCRVCGCACVGTQCRWINPSAKRQLQVVLSPVLGFPVDRDPGSRTSGFMCGKCVFHAGARRAVRRARLAARRARLPGAPYAAGEERLKECVVHVYGRHNHWKGRSGGPDVKASRKVF